MSENMGELAIGMEGESELENSGSEKTIQSKMEFLKNPAQTLADIIISDGSTWAEGELDANELKRGYEHCWNTVASIRNHHVSNSIAFNNDSNPFHNNPAAAKLLLLSFASGGQFESGMINAENPALEFGAVAERIMEQEGTIIAPGIWLTSLFDKYVTFPASTFPNELPAFGEKPPLDLGVTVTYAKSKYKYPLLVPAEGSKKTRVELKIGTAPVNKGEPDLGMMVAKFNVFTETLFGQAAPVQETELHFFPRGTSPKEIMRAYKAKGLSDMQVTYSKAAPAIVNGSSCIHTTPYELSISSNQYTTFGVSIGRAHLGEKCTKVSPLALQTLIPSALFVGINAMQDSAAYQDIANGVYNLPEGASEKQFEASRKKHDALDARIQAVNKYLDTLPKEGRPTTAEIIAMQQRVYMAQETFFDPRYPIEVGESFTLNTSLSKYKPDSGIHVFISEAKHDSSWASLFKGPRAMVGKTTIACAPMMTVPLLDYLRAYNRDMNLERLG